jgi:HEAT repeat protein
MNSKKSLVVLAILTLATLAPSQTQDPQQLAWSILQAGVTSNNSQQRVSAVTVLGLITADPKAVGMAEAALKDKDPDVREAAATALGTLKASSSVPALESALKRHFAGGGNGSGQIAGRDE